MKSFIALSDILKKATALDILDKRPELIIGPKQKIA